MPYVIVVIVVVVVLVLVALGVRVVRPTHRGLVERLGKYNRYASPGFHLIIPCVAYGYPLVSMLLGNFSEVRVSQVSSRVLKRKPFSFCVGSRIDAPHVERQSEPSRKLLHKLFVPDRFRAS